MHRVMLRFHLLIDIHSVGLSGSSLSEERYRAQSGNATVRNKTTTNADIGAAELSRVCQAKAIVPFNRGAAQLYPDHLESHTPF
jgi:hypothetical protein